MAGGNGSVKRQYYTMSESVLWPKLSFALFLLLCCGILAVGLWPFHRPVNEVEWSQDPPSLLLNGYNILLSSGNLDSSAEACSIEVALTPGVTHDSSTVLGFYRPENPLQLSLRQHNETLVLLSVLTGSAGRQTKSVVVANDVFKKGKTVFITATISKNKTAIYIDGILRHTGLPFPSAGRNCSGRLLVGNSAVRVDSWFGRLLGVAIFSSELSEKQIEADAANWSKLRRLQITTEESPLALYLFKEARGSVVHNEVGVGMDLYIPKRFQLLQQPLLQLPWKEYRSWSNFVESVLLNVAAFVPLGCFGYAVFSKRMDRRPALISVVFFGAATSFAIEVLQAYLPTRHSGVTDVFTNSFGTYLGALLWRKATEIIAKHENVGKRPD